MNLAPESKYANSPMPPIKRTKFKLNSDELMEMFYWLKLIRSFDERLRPREAESSLFIGGERSAREPIDVVRSVDEQQVVE